MGIIVIFYHKFIPKGYKMTLILFLILTVVLIVFPAIWLFWDYKKQDNISDNNKEVKT